MSAPEVRVGDLWMNKRSRNVWRIAAFAPDGERVFLERDGKRRSPPEYVGYIQRAFEKIGEAS